MYRQSNGGPIGLRSTCSVARLVMKIWDDEWLEKLETLKIRIEAATRYMDDGRTALHPFHHGWRWSPSENSVKFCKRWEEEDKNLTRTEVTKRILHGTMTGIKDFLIFTMEKEAEFGGWLPSLEPNLAVNNNNIIVYKFFEKPMAANTVLHFRTAMPEDAKVRSLANDLTRRMLTTSERVSDSVRRLIVDEYAQKLLNSGYSIEVTRSIILAGLKGYEKKLRRSKQEGRKVLRTARESYTKRTQRKLLAKTEWFKDKKRPREDELSEDELPEGWKENLRKRKKHSSNEDNSPKRNKSQRTSSGRVQKAGKDNIVKMKTRSTLFVRGTKKGLLARKLREIVEKTRGIVGYNTKIVERSGRKLRNMLSNTNPWKGQACERLECISCKQAEEVKIDCRKRNIIYENVCELCNPKKESTKRKKGKDLEDTRDEPSIYVGESSRSLAERALEHWKDHSNQMEESHMLKH